MSCKPVMSDCSASADGNSPAPVVISSSSSTGAVIFTASQSSLVELIAVFCPPVTLMRSLITVNRDVSAVIAARSKATGNTLMQRYWYMLHYHLVWDIPERDKLKLALSFSLSKDNTKKNWLKKYQDELAAHLARTMRGAGCSNNHVNAAKNLSTPIAQNAPLLTTDPNAVKPKLDPNQEANAEFLQSREDAEFVQRCRDAGVHDKHFLGKDASEEASGLTRGEYRKDARQAKRKGKHAKGGAGAWAEWDSTGNYEY